MKLLVAILLILLTMVVLGCTHAPTSKEYIQSCRLACRGDVQKYSDDLIECVCKEPTDYNQN